MLKHSFRFHQTLLLQSQYRQENRNMDTRIHRNTAEQDKRSKTTLVEVPFEPVECKEYADILILQIPHQFTPSTLIDSI